MVRRFIVATLRGAVRLLGLRCLGARRLGRDFGAHAPELDRVRKELLIRIRGNLSGPEAPRHLYVMLAAEGVETVKLDRGTNALGSGRVLRVQRQPRRLGARRLFVFCPTSSSAGGLPRLLRRRALYIGGALPDLDDDRAVGTRRELRDILRHDSVLAIRSRAYLDNEDHGDPRSVLALQRIKAALVRAGTRDETPALPSRESRTRRDRDTRRGRSPIPRSLR